MRKTISKAIILSVLFSVSMALGQVQLLEQGASGLIPFVGANYNQSNTTLRAGAEYNIEGKFTIGGTYSHTFSDTLFQNSPDGEKILPFVVTPRIAFEFLEPDRVMPLSFTVQGSYSYSSGEDTEITLPIKSTYTQHKYGGGPELGIRFFLAGTGVLVPCLGYSLYSIGTDQVKINPTDGAGKRNKEDLIVHDITIKSPFNYMFSDLFGIVANPEVSVRIGGEKSPDFLISLDLGVLIKSF